MYEAAVLEFACNCTNLYKIFCKEQKKKKNYNNLNYKIQIKKRRDLFIIKELFYTILVPRCSWLNNYT